MEPRQQKFSIGYFIVTFVGLLLLQFLLFAPHTENLSYRDFKGLLKAGTVEDLTLGAQTITGRLKLEGLEGLLPSEKIKELQAFGHGECRFVTVKVEDPALIPALEAAGVQFRGRVESTWLGTFLSWVLPAVVLVAIWGVVIRRMGAASGLMALGKSKAKVYVEKATGLTFDDVAGIGEAKAELVEVVDFLKNPGRYQRLSGKIPRACCWWGHLAPARPCWPKPLLGKRACPSSA